MNTTDLIRVLQTINGEHLNKYYIEHICSNMVRKMIKANIINNNSPETVCYITSASLVWLFSGKDIATPYSGKWEIADKNYKNNNSAVAFSRVRDDDEEREDFEDMLEHTIISLNNIIIDSNWSEKRGLTYKINYNNENLEKHINPNQVTGGYRYIPFDISIDYNDRLKLFM